MWRAHCSPNRRRNGSENSAGVYPSQSGRTRLWRGWRGGFRTPAAMGSWRRWANTSWAPGCGGPRKSRTGCCKTTNRSRSSRGRPARRSGTGRFLLEVKEVVVKREAGRPQARRPGRQSRPGRQVRSPAFSRGRGPRVPSGAAHQHRCTVQLWKRTFRTAKSILNTRPVFHQTGAIGLPSAWRKVSSWSQGPNAGRSGFVDSPCPPYGRRRTTLLILVCQPDRPRPCPNIKA